MKVVVSPQAFKQLKKLPKREARKITRKVTMLTKVPTLGKPLSGNLKGRYSLKAWPYRLIYQFSKNSQVIRIDAIEHRQSVYKKKS